MGHDDREFVVVGMPGPDQDRNHVHTHLETPPRQQGSLPRLPGLTRPRYQLFGADTP